MTVDQILKLIDAGYTKDEINAMSAAPAPQPATPAALAAAPPAPEKAPESVPAAEANPSPAPAAAPAPAAQPAQAPAAAPEAPKAESDAQRILKALGNLAKGVDVPPTHDLSIEEKLGNSILAAMGVKLKKEE